MFTEKEHRKTTFLALSFLFLLLFHFYYVVLRNNILYSYPAYLAFFIPLAVTLIPCIAKETIIFNSRAKQWIVSFIIIFLCSGIGLSLYREIASIFMNIHLPSISQRTLHGPYPLWDVLLNRYHLSIQSQEFLIPTIVGFLGGALILLLAAIFTKLFQKQNRIFTFGKLATLIIFSVGYILTPTFLLAGHGSIPTCPNFNYDAAYSSLGEKLQQFIPPGSSIYIEGYDPIIFSYLPNMQIHPAQLNGQFNYRIGGDASFIEQRGYWNEESALKWLKEADFLFFSQDAYEQRFLTLNATLQAQFQPIADDLIPEICQMGRLIILEKKKP